MKFKLLFTTDSVTLSAIVFIFSEFTYGSSRAQVDANNHDTIGSLFTLL